MDFNAEVLNAILGLASVVLAGAFAYLRQKKVEAEKQGDILLASAKQMMAIVEKTIGEKKPEEVKKAKEMLGILEKAWNDSKVKTPEFEEYFEAFMKVVNAIL